MADIYEPRYLPDGTDNPLYYRRKVRGKSKSGKSTAKKPNKFELGQFIGIDGEGGEVDGKHQYIYLAHNFENIYNPKGLTSKQCFDFLLKMGKEYKHGIFCIFGGGYDMNLWLRDVPKNVIEAIVEADGVYGVTWEYYEIKFVQRRFFSVKYLLNPAGTPPVKVWDIWGFFQGSFVGALQTWLPSYEHLDLIIEGKAARVDFKESDLEFMKRYNQCEVDALVLLMDKLRDAMKALNLTLKGWHGAGAVASAIYKRENIKAHLETPPEPVYTATKHAYFGGRIEIGKYGTHKGTIHHYDINSAYPAIQKDLPSLSGGAWIQRPAGFDTRTTENICIARIYWDNIVNAPFCPFPFRSQYQNKVLFPTEGNNWVWKPELDAALKWRDSGYPYWHIEIFEVWEFIPATDARPFEFIQTDYTRRQEIVAESKRTGIPNGVEKAIKLGLNSLYGKTAQRIGYDPKTGRIPPFHNLVYAGYITAATRAALFDAAMQAPFDIICMATDGIYSTSPLTLDCPKEKVLGKWEYQTHDEMILVQSGVYFLRDGDEVSCYSRGFDRMTKKADVNAVIELIQDAWSKHKGEVFLPCTRFITLKSALCGGDWWERWLSWYEFKTIMDDGSIQAGRKLAITPTGTKRIGSDKRTRADRYMLQTMPTINMVPDSFSMAHNIPWDFEIENKNNPDNFATEEHDLDSFA